MKYIDGAFKNYMENENKFIQEILLNDAKYMKNFYLSLHYFFIVFCSLAVLTPLFEKHLLLRIYFPWVDEALYAYNAPLYWPLYVAQSALITLALFGFKYYICLVVNFIYFGTTLMRILIYKIKALKYTESLKPIHERKKEDLQLKDEILSCIKIHLEIKEFVYFNNFKYLIQIKYFRYINTLNDLTRNIVFIEMLISAINLSFFLFAFGTSDTLIQSVLYFLIVVYNFMTIFVFCLYADGLTNLGLEICDEIYFTNWYNWNNDSKVLLKLMLFHAQNPIFMKIGKIAPMTLDTFKRIGNTTYSYFAMMQRMRT